jgi:hypothetical protein
LAQPEEAMTTPRRRWSFSLRMLFLIITIVCVLCWWVVRSLDLIKQRHTLLAKDGIYGAQTILPLFSTPISPNGLWVFGERGQKVIRISSQVVSERDVLEVRRHFPEATLSLRSRITRRMPGDVDLAPGEYAPPLSTTE